MSGKKFASYVFSFVIFAAIVFCGILGGSGGTAKVCAQTLDLKDAADKVVIAFRMPEWRTMHFDDAAKAEKFAADVERIGCEVKKSAHDDHIDVQCKAADWKPLIFENDEQAHEWINWLAKTGFETLHGYALDDEAHKHEHKEGEAHHEILQFRLADWKSRHAHKVGEDVVLQTVFMALGCEVEVASHGDHSDVKFRCPEWKAVELSSHDSVASWQNYLNELGFETKHEH